MHILFLRTAYINIHEFTILYLIFTLGAIVPVELVLTPFFFGSGVTDIASKDAAVRMC